LDKEEVIPLFPDDFMFELTKKEQDSLRSQFVTLKKGATFEVPTVCLPRTRRRHVYPVKCRAYLTGALVRPQ
jgi:hypothetical protein